MKLSTRTFNIIRHEFEQGYITTIDPSKAWPEYEGYILMLPNISRKRLSEIKDWLAHHGGRLSPPPPRSISQKRLSEIKDWLAHHGGRPSRPPTRSSILQAITLLEENGYKVTPPEDETR